MGGAGTLNRFWDGELREGMVGGEYWGRGWAAGDGGLYGAQAGSKGRKGWLCKDWQVAVRSLMEHRTTG